MSARIAASFKAAKSEDRALLITFVTAGDPDHETSRAILRDLPKAGADIVELGMPFSDPMADGTTIEAASHRALASGQNMLKTLDMVREFRQNDQVTPIVLMGYYNPIYVYGPEAFVRDAANAGVDGLIVVDIPPEADHELCLPAISAGISFIRLAAPTTDNARLPIVLQNTSGFLYYVSIMGITGTATPELSAVENELGRIRKRSGDLPIAVGFGIKTPQQAASIAQVADGVVVGSAIVATIERNADKGKQAVAEVMQQVRGFADALRLR
jgi:tryptophan synthase alpha chain